MTNRRSFFRSLALLGAASAGCPGLFIPKFEPVRWKVHRPTIQYADFTQFLNDQLARFDPLILAAPTSLNCWIRHLDKNEEAT